MATKTISTRVKQRFATISEWMQVWTSFVPLKGEICKIQIPANTEVAGLVKSASKRVLTKTGDGTTTLFNLPWDSAIVANETVLSKGTDATATKSLAHGGTFTAITDTAVNNHQITDTTTTYTLPAETEISVDSATGTQLKPSHGGTFNVVTTVAKGDSSHNVDVTTTSVKLPSETAVSVDTLTEQKGTLTHGGTFTALTAAAKGSSSHNIDVTPTKFTLPAETSISITETDSTESPVRPDNGSTRTIAFGGSVPVIEELVASGHTIDARIATYQFPTETKLSKGNDSNTTETLSHGGTFTAVVDTTVSGHSVSDVTKTFTLPTETAVTVDQGTATETNLSHGGTVTVLTGVTKGNTSHNIDVAKTTIKLPSETSLSKGTDAAGTATTLAHGGKFSAVTDTSVSGHKITDTVTEFTLPAETTLSKGNDTAGTATTLTHGGKFKAVTDTTVSGHTVTDVVTEFTMPSETAVSVDTLSANTKTLTHGETFTVLTAAAKGGSSHNIDVTPTTFTLPAMPTGAMIFKGTLGTNGSVTALPTDAVAGWSYKVITAGTYASHSCTVGDMLVYDGTAWVLIPSGDDEKKGTVTSVKTGQGLSGGTITSSGTLKHVDITRTDTTSTATGSHGGTVTVVDDVTTDTMGHITAVNVKTVTLPSETSLTKGTDATTSTTPTSLNHGGTFTVMTDTSVSGHTITDKNTTFKLPSETAIVTDQLTGTAKTLTHGGTVDVITGVAKGDTSHNVDVTKTTLTLPAETAVNVTATTGSALTPAHGGKITVVTGVAKGANSHDVAVTTQDVTIPAQTNLSKGTDGTASATLTHGGTFTAITETTVSGHKITDTTTTYTLPAETTLSKGTDTTAAKTLEFGKTFTAVTDTAVSGHRITDTTTTFTMPSETTLSKETDATAAATLTHGGTFTAVTDTSVSGHKITDTTTTYTLPAETSLSVDQGTASSSKPAHGGTVTVITGVTKGDSSHNIDVAKTTITFPNETKLSKATDATAATQTLTHGGTFTALTDLTVSNHAITDKPTTFTLPSETTLSVVDNESGNAVTDVTVSGHAITLKRGSNFLTAHPTISKSTDSTSTQTATHGGTISVVDSVTRDSNGHVTKINTKTVTLPEDTNTDTKVKHTRTTTSSYRPILLHSVYAEAGVDPGSATDQVYYNESVSVCPDTGTIKATTFSGKATSATKLATSRKISLGTAVTSTATSFNGSANITIPVTGVSEGYLNWGGKSISGGVTPIGMALSEEHSGNKAAFIDGDAITIEYSTDGTTFTDAAIPKADKTALFTTSCSIPIGGNTAMTDSNYTKLKTRITLTAQDGTHGYIYTDVKKLLVNMSTAVTTSMLIETMNGDSTTWETYGTYSVTGWSGWNDIPLMTTLGGSSSQKDRPWKIRFTFSLGSCSTSYSTTKSVYGFRLFGQNSWNVPSNLGKTGHLYSYDISQNATFPAKVTATEFSGSGASLSNLSAGALTSGIVPRARFPYATTSGVGGVQIGSNISVSSAGVISLTKDNVTAALGFTPTSNTGDITGVTAGSGLTGGGDTGTVTLNVGAGSGISVDANTVSVNTSYTTSGKNYKVAVDSTSGGLYVNVPWSNTTYTFNGAVSTIKDSNLTASRALISDSNGKVAVSAVTSTELGYLDGVTSAIQTQLNGKASSTHSHVWKTF